MDSRLGPDRAPHCDYAELMKTSGEFLQMLHRQYQAPAPTYIPPEIPRRADLTFPEMDNGPSRETLNDTISTKLSAEQRLLESVNATVAMVNAKIRNDQRQNPWKRPRVGQFTIVDVGANDCRFAVTDSAPHFFCGSPTVEGFAYCPDHARLCFRGQFGRA